MVLRRGSGTHRRAVAAPPDPGRGRGSLLAAHLVSRATACLIASLVVVLTAGCGSSESVPGGGPPTGSGIEGTVTVGPTCPGPSSVNDTRDCSEPLSADLQVVDVSTGQQVAETSSDGQGDFQVDLPPGEYAIAVVAGAGAGFAEPVEVTVQSGRYSEAHLVVDSGVR